MAGVSAHRDPRGWLTQELRSRLETRMAGGVDRLPSERALVAELGVSRRRVREVLSILEAEGQVRRIQGRGTVIVRPDADFLPDAVGNLKQYTSPAEMMVTRLALEPAVAALAATHATTQDIEDMRRYVAKGRSAEDYRAWEQWDGSFHRAIGRSTYNSLLIRFLGILNEARAQTSWGRLREASLTPLTQQKYTLQHEKILAAITDRDPSAAAAAMREHLLTVKQTLIDRVGVGE